MCDCNSDTKVRYTSFDKRTAPTIAPKKELPCDEVTFRRVNPEYLDFYASSIRRSATQITFDYR